MKKSYSVPLTISILLAAFILQLYSSTPVSAQAAVSAELEKTGVFVETDLTITMRDGVKLCADLWRPSRKGRFPVLIYRSPYDKTYESKYNRRTFLNAIKRGYAVLICDVRGRLKSGGEFTPYANEGKDGYDTIEWAAIQSWSDGRIGTFGLSYPGAVQWLAAIENPPHLLAICPAMSFHTMRHFIYFGGVFEVAWTGWIYKDMTFDARAKKGIPGPKTYDEGEAEWKKIKGAESSTVPPLIKFSPVIDAAPYYREWLINGPESAYWNFGDIATNAKNTKAAVLNLSGWHDEPYGPQGATINFKALLAARAGWKDPKTALIIGPWTHGAYETEIPASGEREHGSNAAIDYDSVVLDWMDRFVKGESSKDEEAARAKIFVMGADKWRTFDTWPIPGAKETPLYLSSIKNSKKGSLSFRQNSRRHGSIEFTADPQDPVRDIYGTNFGAYDLSYLETREDLLTFDTAPLAKDMEVTGNITAEIFASSEARDFDLFVKLLDVHPDGKAYNLMSPGQEALRVSHFISAGKNSSGRHAEKVIPGTIYKLIFPNLITSNLFKKGHKIRVVICASWHPLYARNLQTGLSEVFSGVMRKARIRIYCGEDHNSRLFLPIFAE